MFLADYHCHTNWSHDGTNSLEEMVIEGIKKGLTEICFTEHYDFVPDKGRVLFSYDDYIEEINRLREIYGKEINIKIGVEVGVQLHNFHLTEEVIKKYPFDFVLASTHRINNMRSSNPDFFRGKTKIEAYTNYFEYILETIMKFDDFDTYGHLDYIVRYGTYENKEFEYHELAEILDKILIQLIKMGKGIEINTSKRRKGSIENHPTREILSRYRELGGHIVTVGSDAHNTHDLGTHIEEAYSLLKELGFEYVTTFNRRKPHYIKL